MILNKKQITALVLSILCKTIFLSSVIANDLSFSSFIPDCSGLDFIENDFELFCDNNATNANPVDDFYQLSFNFSKNNTIGDTYELLIAGISQGFFTYDNQHQISLSTSDVLVEISIVDFDSGCSLVKNIGPLFPCSTDCQIFPSVLIQACYNNITDYDPTDDIHEFTIQSQAINGSSSFDLLVNGKLLQTNSYGAMSNFELPADNSIPTILLVDSDNNQCNFVLPINKLEPCSDICGAFIEDLNYTCIDNNYYVDFNLSFYLLSDHYHLAIMSLVQFMES